jgi:hypothetical protein
LMWMKENEIPPTSANEVNTYFVAHMNRGVEISTTRVRSLADIASLLPQPARTLLVASPPASATPAPAAA